MLRTSFCFLFSCILFFGAARPVMAEEAKKPADLEKLLADYVRGRLGDAQLVVRHLEEQREAGLVSSEEVLAATDETDRWELYLRMAMEWKLVANHPVLGELRKEFLVPQLPPIENVKDKKAISAAIQEYLQKKLRRAEMAAERAAALYMLRRATEAEVAAAKSKVEGLKLLIEAEQLGGERGGE